MKRMINFFTVILSAAIFLTSLSLSADAAAAGSLDTTFGKSGKISTALGTGTYTTGMAIQPDGKFIIVGSTYFAGQTDFTLVRYNADGALDASFDTDGILKTDFSGRTDRALDVLMQPDGKILVAGESTLNGDYSIALARYLPNGNLDPSFDGDGRFLGTPGGMRSAKCAAIEADGKIVLGGSIDGNFGLVRLNLDGSLDTTFNGVGFISTPLPGGGASVVEGVLVQPNGKIVAGGNSINSFALARYNANGTLDTAFGAGGRVRPTFDGYAQSLSWFLQPNGKIVAGGTMVPNGAGQYQFVVARFNADGTPDTTFNTTGFAATRANPIGSNGYDVVVQSDGKIIAAGVEGDFGQYNFCLVRYNQNGTLDDKFGAGGVVKTDIEENDVATVALVLGDKLLVAGDELGGERADLARYNLSAVPSSSTDFDGDGFADYAVFRPAGATWFVLQSASNTVSINQFGSNGDVPLDGDFDGDQRTDLAIFRPGAGQWWINRSSDGQTFAVAFGQTGDKPSVNDFDKDGRTDIALWRPSDGGWYIIRSSDNFSSFYALPFGQSGDILIQAAGAP